MRTLHERTVIRALSLVVLALFGGCAASQDGNASCGGGDIATEEAHFAVKASAAPPPAARACQWSSQCEGLTSARRPACTAPYDNFCYCDTPLANDGSCPRNHGTCSFHVDASNENCVCVPGSIEVGPCAAGKVRKCANSGTSWGSCS